MSLDVCLLMPDADKKKGSGIFVRKDGQIVEITREEWDDAYPGQEPDIIAGDIEDESCEVYSANITHNLGAMAKEAGIYKHLWCPEEIGITKAHELIIPLTNGLHKLKNDPAKFQAFNAKNGWGLYEHFVPFVERYLNACKEYPESTISVWG
jgi:hypothetical protein